MVPTKDVAWHAGNWTLNEHSIGIEHEGIAAEGGTWYTEQMYRASADLVKYLAAKYHIPLDREHILGHEDISRERTTNFAAAHWDAGPYWDWNHYMDLLGAPVKATGDAGGPVVTIKPDYAANQPELTTCGAGTCTPLPAHGANFVHLHTAPDAASPLITDPVVHPDGSAGTTAIDDWSDKAVAGRSYALAGEQGDWTAIWYGGQKAWFANPGHSVTVPARAQRVTAATSAPLYGRAFPSSPSIRPRSRSIPSGRSAPSRGRCPRARATSSPASSGRRTTTTRRACRPTTPWSPAGPSTSSSPATTGSAT